MLGAYEEMSVYPFGVFPYTNGTDRWITIEEKDVPNKDPNKFPITTVLIAFDPITADQERRCAVTVDFVCYPKMESFDEFLYTESLNKYQPRRKPAEETLEETGMVYSSGRLQLYEFAMVAAKHPWKEYNKLSEALINYLNATILQRELQQRLSLFFSSVIYYKLEIKP